MGLGDHEIQLKLSRFCGFHSKRRDKKIPLLLHHTHQHDNSRWYPCQFLFPFVNFDWNHIKRQLIKKSRLLILVIIITLCVIFTRDNAQEVAKFSSIYNERTKFSPIIYKKDKFLPDSFYDKVKYSVVGSSETSNFSSVPSSSSEVSSIITSKPQSPPTPSVPSRVTESRVSFLDKNAGVSESSSSSSQSQGDTGGDSTSPPTPIRVNTQPAARKITFGPEELETTKEFVINKVNFCDDDRGATNDLLVVVNSAVTHFEERDAIRQTWGQFAVERGSLLLFLIGSPDPFNPDSDLIQEKVFREEESHGDLLQGSFIENYYNLTLKTISLLRWVNSTCDQIKYILKVDDDMFVNMQMVVDFCETRTFNKAVIGKLARKWKPHRNPLSKWFVPMSAFNGSIYPNFATGPSYMFSGDAVGPLINTALTLTPIYLEDVYVTGIVAEKAGVRRLNHALIKNVRLRVDACTFKRFMTSHRHSPQEIINLWKLVYDPEAVKNCSSKTSGIPSSPQVKAPAVASLPSSSSRT